MDRAERISSTEMCSKAGYTVFVFVNTGSSCQAGRFFRKIDRSKEIREQKKRDKNRNKKRKSRANF